GLARPVRGLCWATVALLDRLGFPEVGVSWVPGQADFLDAELIRSCSPVKASGSGESREHSPFLSAVLGEAARTPGVHRHDRLHFADAAVFERLGHRHIGDIEWIMRSGQAKVPAGGGARAGSVAASAGTDRTPDRRARGSGHGGPGWPGVAGA